MKVCVVVSGPSAEGRGREIDACDFVVRIKGYKETGAVDAGVKIDAWATRGNLDPYHEKASGVEHWHVRTCVHFANQGEEKFRQQMEDMNNRGRGRVLRWVTPDDYAAIIAHVHKSPSTAMIAIYMALQLYPSCELVLFGFDSTTPDRPRYNNARPSHDRTQNVLHDFVAEKLEVAQIARGTWLGEPTAATLTWPDMPEYIKEILA